MRASYIIAILLAAAAAAWIASGQFEDAPATVSGKTPAPEGHAPAAVPENKAPKVRVRSSVAADRARELVFLGRTEASRKVALKAETAGRIVAVPAREGARVKRGAVIVRLAMDDRQARLGEAKATLRQRRIEYQAARELSVRNFRSKVKLAESEAHLEAAKAALARVQLDVRRVVIAAPFDGVLDTRGVEIGDYVKIGNPVASIVDLEPVLITGHVSEMNVGQVRRGMKARAKLVNGFSIDGVIRFVASQAHDTTRTFKIEVQTPNRNGAIVAGMTAEIRIPLTPVRAHKVSPAVLTLSDAGIVGVKSVNAEGRVAFHPVDIIDEDASGTWVTGHRGPEGGSGGGSLAERLNLITVGQEFVKAGEPVETIAEKDPTLTKLGGGKS
ncbi:MAG: efflux RND transporter periplasmic adaptor subunit [Rhodospirillales bacterium]|jgi:multidrug efflux system membrane fusion protein|nr:efflux transporter periplasmic adaptor subunit [Rhodospirillaceae bacterium]MDP6429354.1 efflux RND transporter periplasmic adaptor subunit [Rhodospirillales bacterium]MDP6644782.1 efflux RND transporter periplasmic adaptor subunit [Rhodospirillales bacterium]MDP6843182.1 efflux RND transporter periplasmic adaptor subunit [Rhodospirillales bacterium]|tara:strand:+ start:313 stop:1470 length:1158 start_codon:yes stop_codon:yes gene_type:complete